MLSSIEDGPRRRDRPRPLTAGPTGGGGPSLASRRIVALVVGVGLLLLLVLATRGCLESRKERAFKDYVREVTALTRESRQQSEAFFALFAGGDGQGPIELENRVNELRVAADQLVDRAKATDRPDELAVANGYLVDVLEFRRDGLGAIARPLPEAARGKDSEASRVAAEMLNFLTSDVLYTQRFVPEAERALAREGYLSDAPIPRQERQVAFLPDVEYLSSTFVGERLAGAGDMPSDTEATPGLHGTELLGVTVNPDGTPLVADGSTEVTGGEDLSFAVEIMNGGESTEEKIPITVTVSGGPEPITVEDTLDTIEPGATDSVTIPLAATPPTGQPVTVEVEVGQVPGEEVADNNSASYQVTFSG